MTIEITLPDTPEEAHEAIHACLVRVLQGDSDPITWLDRIEALQLAAMKRWPGEGFEPYVPCPICDDKKGVPCDRCDTTPPTCPPVGQEGPP